MLTALAKLYAEFRLTGNHLILKGNNMVVPWRSKNNAAKALDRRESKRSRQRDKEEIKQQTQDLNYYRRTKIISKNKNSLKLLWLDTNLEEFILFSSKIVNFNDLNENDTIVFFVQFDRNKNQTAEILDFRKIKDQL